MKAQDVKVGMVVWDANAENYARIDSLTDDETGDYVYVSVDGQRVLEEISDLTLLTKRERGEG